MAVQESMSKLLDKRRDGADCLFNGYLEDYLATDENLADKDLFQQILQLENEMMICVNYGFNANRSVISNQIIRYKDAYKVPDKAMKIPYILYFQKEDVQRGIVLSDDYLLSKGFYYILTEQFALLEDSRNDLIALSTDNEALVLEKIQKLLRKETRAGAIQREADNYYYQNTEELIEIARKKAAAVKENALLELVNMTDRGDYIYNCVMKWYLLKKVAYVTLMMDKNYLKKECDSDIKTQRFKAKEASDSINFIIYSEMWRMKNEEESTEEVEED